MRNEVRQRARRDLDENLRVFQGKRIRRSRWGWLRGVRQALGMRVGEVAKRLKVVQSEVYRLEMAEVRDSITLRRLRAAAAAMGCELVYAVVPVNGTLEDLAEALEKERKKHKTAKQRRLAKADPYGLVTTVTALLELADWHEGKR
jgi:predicted DNA-binding mobile mystery protein A